MSEVRVFLLQFFTCLLVIFAAEVTTGVFAFIGKDVVSTTDAQCFFTVVSVFSFCKGNEDSDTHRDITKPANPHQGRLRRTVQPGNIVWD